MTRRATLLAAMTIGLLAAQTAAAQTPSFDPRSWKRDVAGPKTQVLVLGPSHLSNLKGFQPAWMTATLDKIAVYKPTVVTVEALSGEQCDGLDEALVKRLHEVDGLADENYQIGARLAARCGRERVYAVGDHTADAVHSENPGFGVAIKRIWSGPNKAVATAQAQPFDSAAGMLATYRMANSVGFQRDSIENDLGASIKDRTPEYWGRRYVGWGEVGTCAWSPTSAPPSRPSPARGCCRSSDRRTRRISMPIPT